MNIWRAMDSFFYGKNTTRKVILYYVKIASCFILIILSLLLLYFGQQKWIYWRESAAQKALAQIITRFHEYKPGDIDDATLQELHNTVQVEQERHRSAYLAPYFSNMQAELFIKEGKLEEAIKALDDALTFKTDPVTHSILSTKRALLLLDTNPTQGIEQLEALISNKENVVSDIAQFYLGRYYWVHNDIEKAKTVWDALVTDQSQYRIAQSPYASEIGMLLSSIGTNT